MIEDWKGLGEKCHKVVLIMQELVQTMSVWGQKILDSNCRMAKQSSEALL